VSAQAACDCFYVDGRYVIEEGEEETYDCMTVTSRGLLIIEATLTLNGYYCTSTVAGWVLLTDQAATLGFAATHIVGGGGEIRGLKDTAQITITSGAILSSTTTITGHLEITGEGNFNNQGTVDADATGTLAIKVGGTVDDSDGDDRWRVSTSGATLLFDSAIGTLASMEGEFIVSAGVIYIDEALTTTGRLDLSGGVVDVGQNTTMGDQDAERFLAMTGGEIKVAAGKTFTHH